MTLIFNHFLNIASHDHDENYHHPHHYTPYFLPHNRPGCGSGPSHEILWDNCVAGLGIEWLTEIYRKVGKKIGRKIRVSKQEDKEEDWQEVKEEAWKIGK
jgi:hypothetical protein